MKSLFALLAIISSALILIGTAWLSLALSGASWRSSVGSSAAAFIRQGDATAALQFLSATETPWWLSGVNLDEPKNNIDSSDSDWLATARKKVSDVIDEGELTPKSEAAAKLIALSSEQKKLEESISRLKSRYELLAAGASELFHLELASDEPEFYKGGLLAGLPTLKGLKDEIQTLPELSAVITSAGGLVTVSQFAKSLDVLLTEGRDLSTALVQAESELNALKTEESKLKRASTTAKLARERQLADELESTTLSFPLNVLTP